MAKRRKTSTSRLTPGFKLIEIPGLPEESQRCWKLRFLGKVNERGEIRSPALEAFIDWQRSNPDDFKRIVRSLVYAGTTSRHDDRQRVVEDRKKRGGFELRANRCQARLFFFNDEESDAFIICTNAHSKWKGHHDRDQDAAFARCARMKELYRNRVR